MTPKILFIGSGKGSWEVRGRQIGKALQARVTSSPSADDWRWADVAILVKRAVDTWGAEAKSKHLPLVWDVLDYWQQPDENTVDPAVYAGHIRRIAERYAIDTLIGATQAMADDIGGVYIPHHARPGMHPTPPRDRAEVVVYEGTRKYLGHWRESLDEACADIGMRFVVNPSSLNDADVVVALRDGQWDGPMCRRWKSGVKAVNALAAGRPLLIHQCAARSEVPGLHLHVDIPAQLAAALWLAVEHRDSAYEMGRRHAAEFSIEAVADRYRALVASVLQVAA